MPKIAVCLYGQPRTWRQTIDSILHSYSTYDVDFFASVKSYQTKRLSTDVIHVSRDELSEIFQRYAVKRFVIEDQNTIKGSGPYHEMLYSISNSILLKQQYAMEHSIHYDITCLQRLDCIVGALRLTRLPFNELVVTKMNLNYTQIGQLYGVDDLFLYGADVAINILGANLTPYYSGADNSEKASRHLFMPGLLISEIATQNNLHITQTDPQVYPRIVR